MSAPVRWALLGLGAATLLLGGPNCDGLGADEDDVLCEEAVAHATSCCEDLSSYELRCHPAPGEGCATKGPVVSAEQSRCLLDQTCAELRAAKGCERLVELVEEDRAWDGQGGQSPSAVCP